MNKRITSENLAVSALAVCLAGCSVVGGNADVARAHKEAKERVRTYVYNTDGCDMLYYPTNSRINVDAFIGQRLGFTRGTAISTVSYCPLASGFGYFTVLGVGDPLTHDVVPGSSSINGVLPFAKIGHDCLEMAMTFCREQNFERFMSIRMNDSHDGSSRPHEGKIHPLFSAFRQRHPEYLMGNPEKNEWPQQCAWQWTCVDYSHKEVRDYVRKFVRDFCEKYDMEGIEFDFCRHPKYFKRCSYGEVATDAERAMMTELVCDLRKIAREYEIRKGHPILLNARVPDSFEFCRDIGLDVEAWLKQGALDGIIGGCYFNLNDWKVTCDRVHELGANFYASIDESRIPGSCKRWNRPMIPGRDTLENYYASYAQAMKAGCDGVYLFNLEHDALRDRTQIDPRDTDGRNKIYFATQRGKGGYEPIHYLKNGYKYKNLPYIDPAADPKTVLKDQSGLHDPGLDVAVQYVVDKKRTFELRLADDFAAAEAKGLKPTITIMALTTGLKQAKEVLFTMNGVELKGMSYKKGCAALSATFKDGLVTYENVAPQLVKCGVNTFTVEPVGGEAIVDPAGGKPFVLNDFAVKIEYK